MQTRYNTGQAILIPATIRSAREENGQIIYEVDAEIWNGIPEDAIIVNESAESQRAMQTFMSEIMTERPWR